MSGHSPGCSSRGLRFERVNAYGARRTMTDRDSTDLAATAVVQEGLRCIAHHVGDGVPPEPLSLRTRIRVGAAARATRRRGSRERPWSHAWPMQQIHLAARGDEPVFPHTVRLAAAAAARSIESRLRSTSSSVVAQPLTLIRMAIRPCHRVGPHQHVPSRCSSSIARSVTSVSPKATRT